MTEELEVKGCPTCGLVYVGDVKWCKLCDRKLELVGVTTRGDGSVVFYELPKTWKE